MIRVAALALSGLALVASGCGSDDPGNADEPAAISASEEPAPASPPVPRVEDTQPEIPVVAERLPYADVDDELVYGHFVFPADMVEPLPAVILVHESWGLVDHIRARANRLAGEGYIVLAIDLFGGLTTTDPEEARRQMLSVVENAESARENIRQAYAFVSETAGAPRVGAVGWDFGGGWSLNTAILFPDDLDAAVIVYGQVTADAEALRPVGAPILGLFAGRDRGVSVESVRQFEAALAGLDKNFDIHIYPDAGHGFANPAAAAFDRETAEDAWQRMLGFLELHLAIGDSGGP